jgi:hypothetical protein
MGKNKAPVIANKGNYYVYYITPIMLVPAEGGSFSCRSLYLLKDMFNIF